MPFVLNPLATAPWSVQRIVAAAVMLTLGGGFIWATSALNLEQMYRLFGKQPYGAPLYALILWGLRVLGAIGVTLFAWILVAGYW